MKIITVQHKKIDYFKCNVISVESLIHQLFLGSKLLQKLMMRNTGHGISYQIEDFGEILQDTNCDFIRGSQWYFTITSIFIMRNFVKIS